MFIGKHAVVIGAGMAGLATAGALADWFENVLVMDRDTLPGRADPRMGAPQGEHVHGLLVGGLQALETLFPGFGGDLARAGAVPCGFSRDFREEMPGHGSLPQRDFGLVGYAMSRPLIELVLRERVLQHGNITIRQNCRALGLAADETGCRIIAVRCVAGSDNQTETLPADLAVDASGRGHLTTSLLKAIGRPLPRETKIGIDLGYTTAVMPIPDNAPTDWKAVMTRADLSASTRRAVMVPIEGNRWMLTAAGHGADQPPAEWQALLAYLQGLATPTIFNAVRGLTPIDKLKRWAMPESVRRDFAPDALPDGLIPIGDSICRFNPTYGQGMTVAAKEATLLHRLLGQRVSDAAPLARLGQTFLAEAQDMLETPWMLAAVPDFASPAMRGERPADLEQLLRFATALSRIAVRDAAMQKLMIEVQHLAKPFSAYQDPELVRRIEAELALT